MRLLVKTFPDTGIAIVDAAHVKLLDFKVNTIYFGGIEGVSKHVYVEIHDTMRIKTACEFVQNLIGD